MRVQPQGGILTPAEVPLMLVLTGEAGEQYGYEDELGQRIITPR